LAHDDRQDVDVYFRIEDVYYDERGKLIERYRNEVGSKKASKQASR